MTVIVERMVAVRVKLEAPSMDAADEAFADLRRRLEFSLPKRRYGACTILSRDVIGWTRGGVRKRLEQ